VVFVEYDHVVEQFATERSDYTLGRPILPWASECGSSGVDIEALDRVSDGRREDRVVVVDQVAMGWLVRESFAQLLNLCVLNIRPR